MDAEQIVLAAARLTRQQGLEAWTMRQLADELECSPAVIYHHVGGREAVVRAVVDHVVGTLSSVYASAQWREWFSAVLMEMRVVFRRHPGVAGWLIAHGPALPAMLRILDKGVALLRREGLRLEESEACSVLIDVALSRLAAEELRDDDDLRHEIDHALTRYRGSTERRGLVAVAGLLGHSRTQEYYRYTVECALDGVAMRITEKQNG
ncbi:helix-turn-helix transcriptional regulator [Amycolatopsis sp. H6(2020)]|nr:helix-turn-helix transcriptional regulator [Amycolatopsis sp. H6(2020)]